MSESLVAHGRQALAAASTIGGYEDLIGNLKQSVWGVLPQKIRIMYRVVREIPRGEPELDLLPGLLGEAGGLVDIGANDGPYAVVAAAHGRHTVAFEPVPSVAAKLRRELGRWVDVHQVALSDDKGTGTLFIPRLGEADISTRASLDPTVHCEFAQDRIDVEVDTLDAFAITDVAVVKIDVEGHELAVLRGAGETLARERPALIIEIEECRTPGNLAAIEVLLSRLGYRGWFLLSGVLTPLERFDSAIHQRPENAPQWGERRSRLYVNNFIWTQTHGDD